MAKNTPAPATMPPMAPGATPEENLNIIKQGRAALGAKEQQFAGDKKAALGHLDQMRGDIIRALFGVMQQYGVDPSNPDSVSKFVSELYTQDPDLYAIFELGFTGLTDQSMMAGMAGAPAGASPSMVPPGMPAAPTGMEAAPNLMAVAPEAAGAPSLMNKFSNLVPPSGQQ